MGPNLKNKSGVIYGEDVRTVRHSHLDPIEGSSTTLMG